jgi:hypothetical protein
MIKGAAYRLRLVITNFLKWFTFITRWNMYDDKHKNVHSKTLQAYE